MKIIDPDNPELDDNSYRIFANVIIGIGIVVGLYIWFGQPNSSQQTLKVNQENPVAGETEEYNQEIKDYWTVNGTRGDFTAGVIGTLFSLGGFIYLYLSFKKQRESNEVQLAAFEHDKIENRFFELIRLHRENVAELNITYSIATFEVKENVPLKIVKKKTVNQRQVFHVIRNQYLNAEKDFAYLFSPCTITDIYEDRYLDVLRNNLTIKNRKINLKLFAQADLIYLIVFFGVGVDGRETILSITEKKYKRDFVRLLVEVASLKPKADSNYYENWYWMQNDVNRAFLFNNLLHQRRTSDKKTKAMWLNHGKIFTIFYTYYDDNYEKYYGGHQFRLGHYFRHLYQTVGFINNQADLSPEQQKEYVRHLRGQLSTAEQIVFFFNSLSQLGRIWELADKKTSMEVSRKNQMITDYGLIKNIPNDNVSDFLTLTGFYPEIDYEAF